MTHDIMSCLCIQFLSTSRSVCQIAGWHEGIDNGLLPWPGRLPVHPQLLEKTGRQTQCQSGNVTFVAAGATTKPLLQLLLLLPGLLLGIQLLMITAIAAGSSTACGCRCFCALLTAPANL